MNAARASARGTESQLNVFIEEGLEIGVLQRITGSMARACSEAGVRILAGDTKVVRRG